MVYFNYTTKDMTAKIVYYGPGLSGKTTNLQFIYNSLPANRRGELVSLPTETDRTLFFDLLPLRLGKIGEFTTRLQLYTVPGQVFYNATRRVVLQGVDGIVFVADSQRAMREANIESLENLKENLATYGLTLSQIPWVLQYNKRDLPDILSVEELNRDLNFMNVPYFEAIAIAGVGVIPTLKKISQLTLEYLKVKARSVGMEVKSASKIEERKIAIVSEDEDKLEKKSKIYPVTFQPKTVTASVSNSFDETTKGAVIEQEPSVEEEEIIDVKAELKKAISHKEKEKLQELELRKSIIVDKTIKIPIKLRDIEDLKRNIKLNLKIEFDIQIEEEPIPEFDEEKNRHFHW